MAAAARLEERISKTRLGVALAAVIVAWLVIGPSRFSSWWLLAPAAAFAALVVAHARARRGRRRAERGVAFYRRGLARLDGQWAGTGSPGTRFADPHHSYAADLDIFGRGSLFELVSSARTSVGEETLAAWLLAPADAATLAERQEAIRVLAPQLDLREELAVLGEEMSGAIQRDALRTLAAPAAPSRLTALRVGAAAVTALTLVAIVAWAAGAAPPIVVLVMLAVQALVDWRLAGRVRDADRAVAGHGPDLERIAEVLERFERAPLDSRLLTRLHADLVQDGIRPSQAIRRLRLWVDLLDSRRNQFFTPIALGTMWGVHCALAIEAWRARRGAAVEAWLAAVGQLEALCSLAGYAWEHPSDVYPAIEDGEPRFEAAALGHPLIPPDRCVTNDVALGPDTRVLIVSGSNMSGKSTLLRAVGVNAVLALAGAPVRASRLRLTRLALGATLRIQDSLEEGTSRFYAELVRLRDLVRIAEGPIPLLFLLDEILHGTNSHDRRLGAAAVVRGLLARRAIGLVTTHDLALSALADDRDLSAANVHFEDRLEDGRMVFDYRMRPGVVRTSNALALMRALGLIPADGAAR